MLQFWKKEKPKSTSPEESPSKLINGTLINSDDCNLMLIGPLSDFKQESFSKPLCDPKSRLTLSLEDVLTNKTALSYFGQFIESRGWSSLLSIWLDLEQVPLNLRSIAVKRVSSGTIIESPNRIKYESENLESTLFLSKIYKQYLNDDVANKIKVPDELKLLICLNLSQNSKEQNNKAKELLEQLKSYIYEFIRKEIWNDFLRSDWHCKYLVEIMTSGAMTLSDVIYNDDCLSNFIEFLEQENLVTVIEFWLSATSFEKQFTICDNIDPVLVQNDAVTLYDKYLSLQATRPLGIAHRVRLAVEEGISGTSGASTICFRPALSVVEYFLKHRCLKLYLSSSRYLALLSEVMASTSGGSVNISNELSPSSSMSSLERPPPSTVTTATASDIDSLWRRKKKHNSLSFGRIDRLGRFETDCEPIFDKKATGGISRMLKFIVGKDEQKIQEEMAWRVAEMIINDVTSITLGSHLDNDDDDEVTEDDSLR